jgi:iron complex outermembrane receptor protein
MSTQITVIAAALISAFSSTHAWAQAQGDNSKEIKKVTVSANPLGKDENLQVLTPTKVLSGEELRSKVASSLGETLSSELGVNASGFGAGASRPIIRGLEGPRVKILQNGMSVADVSSLSNDHAVATETASSQQIEILRGPAALLFGSGAIGGLVNVVDGRIPSSKSKEVTGEVELKYGGASKEKNGSFYIDGSSGDIALHADGNARNNSNYQIPGYLVQGDATSGSKELPSSFTRERSLGFGASYIQNWGHVGAAVQNMNDRYGIPTDEKSFIDLKQTRIDFDTLIKQKIAGFDQMQFKLGHTDYMHTEKQENGTPITDFKNRSLESRFSLTHLNWAGWEGNMGFQTETQKFSALSVETGRADTVPTTQSRSLAAFILEQKQFGDVLLSAGARAEHIKRTPDAEFKLASRQFNLYSSSIGGLWNFTSGYALGSSLSLASRAPTTEELYSNGPHESTLSFDIGDINLKKENSKNLELSLQKTQGAWRWKANLFLNKVNNYVYAHQADVMVDEEGNIAADGEFALRHYRQANATIRGGEMELGFNMTGSGWSYRAFADTSRGTLNQLGNLPLQAANRFGLDIGYRNNGWRNTLSLIHAQKQDRLASTEHYITPSYTKVDANISYTHPYMSHEITWFLQAKNLLNQDIRLATSLIKETTPQAKRAFLAGVRMSF